MGLPILAYGRERLPHQYLLQRPGRRLHRGYSHLKVCSTFGADGQEALREVELAKSAWLETAREQGKPIPEPMYRPIIYQAG